MEEFEDWGLSAAELDSLEEEAIRKISERNASTATASISSAASSSPLPPQAPLYKSLPPKSLDQPPSRTSQESSHRQAVSPSGLCVPDASREAGNNNADNLPKISVRLFLHSSGAIAAKFPYNALLIEAFHKIPKASWHGKERVWMFPVSSLAAAEEVLSEVAGIFVEVEKLDPLARRALASACAVPDLQNLYDRIPSDIELKLLPFQRDGVRFVLQHGGRALLADEMGLGKTLQAIAVTLCIRDSWPVLVITPSSLRLHWASMIHQWLNIPSSDILVLPRIHLLIFHNFASLLLHLYPLWHPPLIQVVLSQSGGSNRGGFNVIYSNTKATIHLDGIFNIISYDVVPKLQTTLLASHFKIVIADESHFLKNAQAKRTSATLPVLQKAQYAILLSGTPALSRPIELFKQLEALYPDVYRNVHEFGNRYCKGGIFGLYQGSSNHEELHNLMKATVMIRRLKKDVLSELPVKRRQQVFLDLKEKDIKEIRALFRELLKDNALTTGLIEEVDQLHIFPQLEVVKSNIQACDSSEKLESLKITQKILINKIYNDSAEAKIPAVLDYLGTVIEADCKFLIFAHHQPMVEAIHQFLLKKKVGCIRIDGGTPSSLRQALVTDFQAKEDIKAAVLSIKAGGVGLTLTAASTVIFAELSWTPGDIIQAEDRAHRIGQLSSVNVYYLLANDTVDDIIWDVVQSKLENLGQVLDGQENTLQVSVGQTSSSPAKQKTLDSFLKRCHGNTDDRPKAKEPRR